MKQIFSSLLLQYLAVLARLALSLNRPAFIIGIAGSVGKSSTRNAMKALLQDKGKTVAIGNSETGIPLGILGITPKGYRMTDWLTYIVRSPLGIYFLRKTKFLIVEMGIDDPYPPKNMSYLLSIIKPDVSVLVNESAAHTEQFEKTLTKKQKEELSDKEKVRLLTQKIADEDVKIVDHAVCRTIIYNDDNVFIKKALNALELDGKKLIGVGEGNTNDVSYTDYALMGTQSEFGFKTKSGDLFLSYPELLPKEYREVLGLSLAVFQVIFPEVENKEKEAYIRSSLSKHFSLPKGRGSTLRGMNDSLIIDSSYNASKIAVFSFLEMIRLIKKQTGRPVVLLFGDMRELGEESEIEHTEVAKKISDICEYVYLVGNLTKSYVLPALEQSGLKEVRWFRSNVAAGEYLAKNLPKNAVVLVKGSQNRIFLEESIKYILADKRDRKKLCRQDDYWLAIKKQQERLAGI